MVWCNRQRVCWGLLACIIRILVSLVHRLLSEAGSPLEGFPGFCI